MESFAIELVSKALGQPFQDTTLSSTNFLPEQLSLEGQWDVAISEISYPSMYQIVTRGNFVFYDKKIFWSRLTFSVWNPISTLPLRMLLKPWTLSFKKNRITAKVVSLVQCLEEGKKLGFIL